MLIPLFRKDGGKPPTSANEPKVREASDLRRVPQTGRVPSQTFTGVMEKLHGRAVRQPNSLLSLTVMRKWLVVKSELQANICGQTPASVTSSFPVSPITAAPAGFLRDLMPFELVRTDCFFSPLFLC